jgi:hypothetical protein
MSKSKLKEKRLEIHKWEKVGDKVNGQLKAIYQGTYGPVFQIGNELFGINQITLLKCVKQANKDGALKIGSTLEINFVKKVKRTKIFTLTVNKKLYESSQGFTPLKIDKLDALLDDCIKKSYQPEE